MVISNKKWHKMKTKIWMISMMCLVAMAAKAQSINGRILDEQSQPMTFTNVVLLNRRRIEQPRLMRQKILSGKSLFLPPKSV